MCHPQYPSQKRGPLPLATGPRPEFTHSPTRSPPPYNRRRCTRGRSHEARCDLRPHAPAQQNTMDAFPPLVEEANEGDCNKIHGAGCASLRQPPDPLRINTNELTTVDRPPSATTPNAIAPLREIRIAAALLCFWGRPTGPFGAQCDRMAQIPAQINAPHVRMSCQVCQSVPRRPKSAPRLVHNIIAKKKQTSNENPPD